jgi:hypothetical protein
MAGWKRVFGRFGWAMLIGLWLVSVVGGLGAVARYSNTAGAAAAAPGTWPGRSRIARHMSGSTLVMIAHPRCTCTRASLAELAEIMARSGDRARAYVVFVKPGRLEGRDAADLLDRAAAIPGVTIVRDDEGAEAAAFGAETSGQIFLYDRSGRLRFSGGTTPSRGHAGENAGRAAILALLNDQQVQLAAAPVFGCSLYGAGDRPGPDAPDLHDARDH